MTAPMDAKLCRAPNPLMAAKSIGIYLEQNRLADAVAALKDYGEQYAAYALAEVERTRTPPAMPSPEVAEELRKKLTGLVDIGTGSVICEFTIEAILLIVRPYLAQGAVAMTEVDEVRNLLVKHFDCIAQDEQQAADAVMDIIRPYLAPQSAVRVNLEKCAESLACKMAKNAEGTDAGYKAWMETWDTYLLPMQKPSSSPLNSRIPGCNSMSSDITDHLWVGLPRVGWICPKCKRIYAPDTEECKSCNKDKSDGK